MSKVVYMSEERPDPKTYAGPGGAFYGCRECAVTEHGSYCSADCVPTPTGGTTWMPIKAPTKPQTEEPTMTKMMTLGEFRSALRANYDVSAVPGADSLTYTGEELNDELARLERIEADHVKTIATRQAQLNEVHVTIKALQSAFYAGPVQGEKS